MACPARRVFLDYQGKEERTVLLAFQVFQAVMVSLGLKVYLVHNLQ